MPLKRLFKMKTILNKNQKIVALILMLIYLDILITNLI